MHFKSRVGYTRHKVEMSCDVIEKTPPFSHQDSNSRSLLCEKGIRVAPGHPTQLLLVSLSSDRGFDSWLRTIEVLPINVSHLINIVLLHHRYGTKFSLTSISCFRFLHQRWNVCRPPIVAATNNKSASDNLSYMTSFDLDAAGSSRVIEKPKRHKIYVEMKQHHSVLNI